MDWWLSIYEIEFLNNTLGKWFVALAAFIIVCSFLYIIFYYLLKALKKFTDKTNTSADDFFYQMIKNIKNSIIILSSVYFSLQFITIPPNINTVISKIITIYLTLRIALFIQKFIIGNAQKTVFKYLNKKLQRRVQPVLGKLMGAILWFTVALLVVGNLGYNLTSLIAGLGIGGLFIGLAAQETLSNFFSSLAVFLDQPFDIGDIVEFDDVEGTVEDLGIRSTRIRTFEATLVVIPNNLIAKNKINNLSKRKGRRTVMTLGVEYSTSTMKLKKAVAIVKETLESHVHIQEKGMRIHFVNFGASSLDIEAVYFIDLLENYNQIQNVREEVNFRIKSQFEKEGIEFAFPTQTLHVVKG